MGKIKYLYKGKPAIQVAKKNGISKNAFILRITKLKWSVKDACTFIKANYKELSRITGMSENQCYYLLHNKGVNRKELVKNPEYFKKNFYPKKY